MASLAAAIDVDAETPTPRVVRGTGSSAAPLELESSDSDNDAPRAKRRRSDVPPPAQAAAAPALLPIAQHVLPPDPVDGARNSFESFLSQGHHNGNRKPECLVYLCCRESTESFRAGLARCKESCDEWPHIQDKCMQRDGSRHISFHQGRLSADQVREIAERCSGLTLPTEVAFAPGFNNWSAGNYIGLAKSSRDALRALKEGIMGQIKGGKANCDHLSLYRKRVMKKHPDVDAAFASVRRAMAGYDWGSLPVHSIRIKIMRKPYDECKVLLSV